MQIALYVLSAVMMLSGLYGLFAGWDIIMVERGWSQFIAGASVFAAGAVVLAIAFVIREVRKLRREFAALTIEVDQEPTSPPLARAPNPPSPAPTPIASHDATAERSVVGSYASGGVTYFMYADHSIEAELPEGRYRFASMEELRGYLDNGTGGALIRKGQPED